MQPFHRREFGQSRSQPQPHPKNVGKRPVRLGGAGSDLDSFAGSPFGRFAFREHVGRARRQIAAEIAEDRRLACQSVGIFRIERQRAIDKLHCSIQGFRIVVLPGDASRLEQQVLRLGVAGAAFFQRSQLGRSQVNAERLRDHVGDCGLDFQRIPARPVIHF